MSSVKKVLPIVQSQKILGQAVAYYPTIAKAFKSPEIALFICQFIYWCDEFEDDECNISSWISKSANDIYNNTGITPDAQITVRKKLKSLSVLFEKREGLPATMHYKFDFGRVNQILCDGIVDTRKKRIDNQPKDKNGKFSPVPVNYGNNKIEAVPVNSSIPQLRVIDSVNYGNLIPLNTETLYNKNLILEELERESEKEFSQPLPPVSEIAKLEVHPDEVNDDLTNGIKSEIKENTPQVPPTPLKEKGFMVYSQNEFEENLMNLFSDPINKDELKTKLKKFSYSENGIINRKQAEIIFSIFSDWLLKEKDPDNFIHYFSPSKVKRDFLSALSWIISKEVVKNAFKKPFQNSEKPNYAPSNEKPRYA